MKYHFLKKHLLTLCFIFLLSTIAEGYDNFGRDIHFDRLKFLRDKGFDPEVIYDIGAYRGQWSMQMKDLFTDAQFYLFEANERNSLFLNLTSFPTFIALLGDREQLVTFYTNDLTGDSVFCEQTKYYQEHNSKKKELLMTKLDTVVRKNQIPPPDLIKFDVQGAEKIIIQGSPQIVMNAEVVILETKILEYNKNAPLVFETISLMNALGYSILDILECHYLPTGELNEVDFLFVKNDSKLIKKGLLIE